MKIRCIIVDDEPPAIDELNYILGRIDDVEVLTSCGSASEAIEAIEKLNPDVVFLDIHMPRHSGLHIAEKVAYYEKPPLIIFVTAYDQYAVEAFEKGSIDYILKPFSEKRIRKALLRVKEILAGRIRIPDENDITRLIDIVGGIKHGMNRLPVEKKGHVLLIDPSEILFCKAEDKKVMVYSQNDLFSCHGGQTLEELAKKFKFHSFFRTHRAYPVNLDHVREVISWFSGRYLLVMSDKSATEVPVSRNRVKDLKQKLGL